MENSATYKPANPLTPHLARTMVNALKKAHDGQFPSLITASDLEALRAVGLTAVDLARSGTILVFEADSHKLSFLTVDPVPVKLEDRRACDVQPSQESDTGWKSQGGNDVHREDNDMPLPTQEASSNPDDFTPCLRVSGISPIAEPEWVAKSLNHAINTSCAVWDTQRMIDAAHTRITGQHRY